MIGSRGKRELQIRVDQLTREKEELLQENQRLRQENRQLKERLARAGRDSTNSSKPPSSDIVQRARAPRRGARKIGGQPGHPRHQRPSFSPQEVDVRTLHAPCRCPRCGSRDLEPLPEPVQTFQQAELVQKPLEVLEHVVQRCRCHHCNGLAEGSLPDHLQRTGLVGPRMMSLMVYLKGSLHLSYSGLAELLDHALGLKVSRGYLAKVMNRASAALEEPVEDLRQRLPHQPWLNVDETGHKENGARMWTWCFRAPQFVLFAIRASRGSPVLLEHLGEAFQGVLGCDFFSAYRKYMRSMDGKLQFCFAHLIRELKFLVDHPSPSVRIYGEPLLEAIREMFQLIHRHVEEPIQDFENRLRLRRQRILEAGTNTAAISTIDWYVKKQYPEVANLARRFQEHGESYFTFLTTPQVGPTNNAAEQALRFVVLNRRATQGTRGPRGRDFCERLWTVVGTCRMNGRSIFGYLRQAFEAWAHRRPVPPPIPEDTS